MRPRAGWRWRTSPRWGRWACTPRWCCSRCSPPRRFPLAFRPRVLCECATDCGHGPRGGRRRLPRAPGHSAHRAVVPGAVGRPGRASAEDLPAPLRGRRRLRQRPGGARAGAVRGLLPPGGDEAADRRSSSTRTIAGSSRRSGARTATGASAGPGRCSPSPGTWCRPRATASSPAPHRRAAGTCTTRRLLSPPRARSATTTSCSGELLDLEGPPPSTALPPALHGTPAERARLARTLQSCLVRLAPRPARRRVRGAGAAMRRRSCGASRSPIRLRRTRRLRSRATEPLSETELVELTALVSRTFGDAANPTRQSAERKMLDSATGTRDAHRDGAHRSPIAWSSSRCSRSTSPSRSAG